MLNASHDDGTPQAGRLEQMKTEFLVAQQRRRGKPPEAAAHSDGTDDGPPQAGPADGALSGIVAVRPGLR